MCTMQGLGVRVSRLTVWGRGRGRSTRSSSALTSPWWRHTRARTPGSTAGSRGGQTTARWVDVQYSTVQYSTVQYSYSTVQYSTVQYSTAGSKGCQTTARWELPSNVHSLGVRPWPLHWILIFVCSSKGLRCWNVKCVFYSITACGCSLHLITATKNY